ncbi:MAG: tetratricopeptide repeat-containing sulfotransferase family protein [Rhodanobacter sp.]
MIDSTRAFGKLVAAFNQNDWARVQQRSAQLLIVAPDDARVRFMAGVACLQMQQMPQALEHLLKATHIEPRRADYVAQYASALALARRLREARLVADRAMTLSPDNAHTLGTLGAVYQQANALMQSANAFRRAAALMPEHAASHLNLAYALNALGDIEGAEQALEAGIRLEPHNWYAHLLLAQLRTQIPGHNHVERISGLLQSHGHAPGAALLLNMALGKEYEDLADYPRAFDHYARGKAAGRSMRPYAFERDEAIFEALLRAFPASEAEPTAAGDPSREPIFIIGMPRSGIDLLNRLLAGHPDVRSAGELQHFSSLLQRASGCRTALLAEADIAARSRHIDWRQLGADYLASARPGGDETPHFIDRLPHNFFYVGFIARALPNAKILCLRRDPLDTCIGNFRHLFRQESGLYDYAFDLDDISRYIIRFERLMAHWNTLFPGRIHTVRYESLVEAPEATMRELLAFCGLPWSEACLTREGGAAPANASTRMPAHHEPIGHWRHYEAQLRDVRWRLVAAGIGAT